MRYRRVVGNEEEKIRRVKTRNKGKGGHENQIRELEIASGIGCATPKREMKLS